MIIEVGGKILDTFAGCLSGKLASPEAGEASKPAAAATRPRPQLHDGEGPSPSPGGCGDLGRREDPSVGGEARFGCGLGLRPGCREDRGCGPGPGEGLGVSCEARPGCRIYFVSGSGEGTRGQARDGRARGQAGPDHRGDQHRAEARGRAARAAQRPGSPETEAIDLLDYAGASVLKRLAPVVLGIAAIVGLVAIIRALRK